MNEIRSFLTGFYLKDVSAKKEQNKAKRKTNKQKRKNDRQKT